jgi:uncharacterized protein
MKAKAIPIIITLFLFSFSNPAEPLTKGIYPGNISGMIPGINHSSSCLACNSQCGDLSMYQKTLFSFESDLADKYLDQPPLISRPEKKVMNRIESRVEFFDPEHVQLLESQFKRAMDTDIAYLLRIDPKRFISWFHKQAGILEGDVLCGWGSKGIGPGFAQQSTGHYITACSQLYRVTGDTRFLERVNFMVDELYRSQRTEGNDGLVASEKDAKAWEMLKSGIVQTNGKAILNGAVVPFYSLHKVMAGLLDAYDLCGNEKALKVLLSIVEWCKTMLTNLDDDKMQALLSVEHGGMAEILANLYAFTGDQSHLALARKFCHRTVMAPMIKGEDNLTSLHANTQIPKFAGYQRIYELTGEQEWNEAARNFWKFVAEDRTFANGGNSLHELFHPLDQFENAMHDTEGPETCNTYNMLKLTRYLFSGDPVSKRMDYYEKALYNQILPSQHPVTGGFTYFQALVPGAYRTYSVEAHDFWCCVGTGMENHTLYGMGIYNHKGDKLYVNLFIPSVLNWHQKDIKVEQTTNFPDEAQTRLKFTLSSPETFTIAVRNPKWVIPGRFNVKVNDKSVAIGPGVDGYHEIKREWKNGDILTVELPMQIQTEMLPNTKSYVSLFYGPLLLAARLGNNGLSFSDFRTRVMPAVKRLPAAQIPAMIIPDTEIARHLTKVPDEGIKFIGKGLFKPSDVMLIPYNQIYDERYSVYFRLTSNDSWEEDLKRWTADEQQMIELEKMTLDEVRPGEQQPEIDHGIQSNRSNVGTRPAIGRTYRDATDEGWFSYQMSVDRALPVQLHCTYWGSDFERSGFEIWVDDYVIADEKLVGENPGEFISKIYPVPPDVTKGKEVVTVKFRAKKGMIAGGVYQCRMLLVK